MIPLIPMTPMITAMATPMIVSGAVGKGRVEPDGERIAQDKVVMETVKTDLAKVGETMRRPIVPRLVRIAGIRQIRTENLAAAENAIGDIQTLKNTA